MFSRRDQRFHKFLCQLVVDFFWEQSQTACDAKDMRVHWEKRFLTGEEQNAGGGFRPNAFERSQKAASFINGQSFEKGQVEISASLQDFVQDVFDDDRFYVGQAAGLNRRSDTFRACLPDRLPIRKSFFQARKRPMAVNVGGGL